MSQSYQALQQDLLLELYVLDLSPVGINTQIRFCNWAQANGTDVSFNGQTYTAFPIQSSGFERSTGGSLPTPEITVSNVFSAISSLTVEYDGLLGAKLTRYKVFESNLDGKPGANPAAIESVDIYYISRYSENSMTVTFSLRHPLELQNVRIPRRRLAALTD